VDILRTEWTRLAKFGIPSRTGHEVEGCRAGLGACNNVGPVVHFVNILLILFFGALDDRNKIGNTFVEQKKV
jgi:hypothetical protein